MTAISDAAFGLQNPMTSENDIIVGDVDGEPQRLGVGVKGDVLAIGDSGLTYADVTHSAYDVLDEIIVDTNQSSLSFSSINQSYRTLVLEGQLRVEGNTGSEFGLMTMYINGDEGSGNAHYTGVLTNIGGTNGTSSVNNNEFFHADGAIVGYINAHLAPANAVSYFRLTLHNYTNSIFFKSIKAESNMQPEDNSDQAFTAITSATWAQTDPITLLEFFCDAGNFVTGSTLTLYGIAGSKIADQRLNGSVPTLAIDYKAGDLYNNITFTAGSWQNFGPPMVFNIHDRLSIVSAAYGGYATVSGGSNTNLALRIVLDSATNNYVGGVYITASQTISFLNNIIPIDYTNLTIGSHTLQLQVNPLDNDVAIYCMPITSPGYSYTVQAIEFIPPQQQLFPTLASGFVPITSQTLQQSKTTLNLDAIPQEFQSLRMIAKVRGTNPSNTVSMFYTINGDSNNVYETILNLTAHSSGPQRVDFDAQESGSFGDIPATFSSVWNYAYYTIDIPFYVNTIAQGISWSSNSFDATNSMLTAIGNTQYHGTTGAIKSMELFLSDGDFAANSALSLYGLPSINSNIISQGNGTNIGQVKVVTAQNTIDFPAIPLGYTDLQLRTSLRSTLTSTDTEYLLITINGDSGSHYTNEALYGDDSTGATSVLVWNSENTIANIVADNAAVGVFTPVNIRFSSYDNDSTMKSYIVESYVEYTSGSFQIVLLGGRWTLTDPITSISLSLGSGQFAPDSIATLYTEGSIFTGTQFRPYFEEVLMDAPIAYWMLNDTQTSFVYDASGNGNTATNGGGVTSNTTGLPSGGYAMDFDGTGAINLPIDLPNAGNVFGPVGSLEFWFKSNDPSNVHATLICTDIFISQTDASLLNTYAFSGNFSSGIPYCDNNWHHVVYNYNESTQLMDVWVDGREILYQESYISQFSESGIVNYRIGAYQDPGTGGYINNFSGTMAHVAFYNKNLPPNRIANHYFSGITPFVGSGSGGPQTGIIQSILYTLAIDEGPLDSTDITTQAFPDVTQDITVQAGSTIRVKVTGSVTAGTDVDEFYLAPVLDGTTLGTSNSSFIPANLRALFSSIAEFTSVSAGTHTITLNYFTDNNNIFIRPITYAGIEGLYMEVEEIR